MHKFLPNYVQQIVQNYQTELAGNTPSLLNKTELVVRNWYNPNLNYKWFIVPSLVALIITIGVMIVTSLSVAREREQGTLDQLLVSPLSTWQIFVGKAVPAMVVAFHSRHYCIDYRDIWLPNTFFRFTIAVLLYHANLWFIAGGFWLINISIKFNTTTGFYWCVCIYDASRFTIRLYFPRRKHARLATTCHMDKPYSSFYRYHKTDLP